MRRRLALALGFLLALSVLPARAQAQADTISEVVIEGNDATEESLIRSRFPLAGGDRYNAALAREGIKDLYALGLFDDITLLTEESDGELRLIVRVSERPRVSGIRFEGNDHLGADELKERITLGKGQLFDPATLEAARREILSAFREEGYPLSEVVAETEPSATGGDVAVVFRIDEGERVRLRRINFLGNAGVRADDLRGAMQTRPKGFLRSGRFELTKFEEDLERITSYYRDHGYRDAKVVEYDIRQSDDRRDLFVDIQVEEGALYTMTRPTWDGNAAVPDDLIERQVRWVSGEPYSRSRIQETSAAISEVFTERGFLLGFDVDAQEAVGGDHEVAVHYSIREGDPSRVGKIKISGNSRTKEKVIRRELTIFPGQTFRRSALMRSQRDVFALGYFDDVQVQFSQSDPGSNDIDIEFDVTERRLGTAGAGLGFSSATGITGFVQIGHNNLFGNGWDMNIHLERGSRRSQYELSFTEPWLLNRPISLGIQLFDTETDRDVFDDRRRGLSMTLGWPFPGIDFTRAFATLQVQKIDIPFIAPSLSERSRRQLLDSQGSIVSMRVGASRSTTDNPFYPTSGSRTSWSSEFSGGILGGTVDFHKHIFETRTYLRPFWKPVVMFRGRLGTIQPYAKAGSVPGYETFRLGGTLFNYLRGYDDYDIVPEENITVDSFGSESRFPGGRYMATMTLEYQFPIAHPLNALFFLDMGDTWNDVTDISLTGMKRGAGAGLRMEVPMLGILGLDYAYGFDRAGGGSWKPHLIFGRQF